jgi:hypothetical protein
MKKMSFTLISLTIVSVLLAGCMASTNGVFRDSMWKLCDGEMDREISNAFSNAMVYAPSDGINKIVVLVQSNDGDFNKLHYSQFPNADYSAENMAETELVACLLFEESQEAGSCPYIITDGSGKVVGSETIQRFDVKYQGIVYEAKTGEVVTTFQVEGNSPACDNSLQWSRGELKQAYASPDSGELFLNLQPYIEQEYAGQCTHVSFIRATLDKDFKCTDVLQVSHSNYNEISVHLEHKIGSLDIPEDVLKVEGVRVEVNGEMSLGGKTYMTGAKLTVLNGEWVEVQEWD